MVREAVHILPGHMIIVLEAPEVAPGDGRMVLGRSDLSPGDPSHRSHRPRVPSGYVTLVPGAQALSLGILLFPLRTHI